MKLLLHACCGPCSMEPLRILLAEGHDISIFYANSNIAPEPEYRHRLSELLKFAAHEGVRVIEGNYDPAQWERYVAPIGRTMAQKAQERTEKPTSVAELLDDANRRNRCRACYKLRLCEAAHYAHEHDFDAVSTTLSVSPYQFTDIIREELARACKQNSIAADFRDFRPYYDEATRRSREAGMYRQDYCGCSFSIDEGKATRAFIKEQREEQRALYLIAHEAERKAEAEKRRARKAEQASYNAKQARKRDLLRQFKEQQRAREHVQQLREQERELEQASKQASEQTRELEQTLEQKRELLEKASERVAGSMVVAPHEQVLHQVPLADASTCDTERLVHEN